MRTITKKAYKFSELSNAAKENAIEKLYDINVDYDWWDFCYDDAEQIGIKIEAFELDRYCHIDIINSRNAYLDIAESIIENHGDCCDTYKIAMQFKQSMTVIQVKFALKGEEYDDYFDEYGITELEEQFKEDIAKCYLVILNTEYEYRTSDQAIIETIECNDYEFTKDGTMI